MEDMIENYTGMNTGTRVVGMAFMGGELVRIIYDARWLLAVITLCVMADFWYGWSESRKRYERAKQKKDKIVMAQYRWRTSRAVRRTPASRPTAARSPSRQRRRRSSGVIPVAPPGAILMLTIKQ